MSDIKLIIDFDSTFVQTEGLEELATIALANNIEREIILDKIKKITELGMSGEVDFAKSLKQRLELLAATKEQVKQAARVLLDKITSSFLANKEFIRNNRENIFVFSGGFKDFISLVLEEFSIPRNNIFSNEFIYNSSGKIIGFDESNNLAQTGGKIKQLQALNLPGEIWVIGDGWTDYEMRESGLAHKFFAFTENVKREKVVENADQIVENFDEVVRAFNHA